MGSPDRVPIPRQHGSIRRSSHIDMHLGDDQLVLDGRARDLITTATGGVLAASASVRAEVDAAGAIRSLTIQPYRRSTGALLGRSVRGGFRDAAHESFPDEFAAGTALALLLDDLPVAALISGYALLYVGAIPSDAANLSMKSDICSGWRAGGTMMTSVRAGHGVPVTVGPSAPASADDRSADPLGWHDIAPLPIGSMRRRRLIDVHPAGGVWEVTAMFRDTHVDADGAETILHEYALTATVDAATQMFIACAAVPRVLPWVECPVAAGSADRLTGQSVGQVRSFVRSELRGTSTCTHLNDLLRSLGDVGALAARLGESDNDPGVTV